MQTGPSQYRKSEVGFVLPFWCVQIGLLVMNIGLCVYLWVLDGVCMAALVTKVLHQVLCDMTVCSPWTLHSKP